MTRCDLTVNHADDLCIGECTCADLKHSLFRRHTVKQSEIARQGYEGISYSDRSHEKAKTLSNVNRVFMRWW